MKKNTYTIPLALVFINCRIIVGSRLLLIAHRKKRQKTNAKGIVYVFFFMV